MKTQFLTLALGLAGLCAGCSGGGGSGSSGSAAAGATAQTQWDATIDLSTTPGSAVAAIEPASATEVLAATPPEVDVARVDASSAQLENGLLNPPQSLATAGGEIYAGSGEAGVAGSGDVYQRVQGAWQMVLDGDRQHVVVVTLGADLYALEGEAGVTPQVSVLSGGAWTSTTAAFPQDCVPTQAVSDGTALWVGATQASGDALLFYGDANGFTQVPMPSAMPAAGEQERVTGLGIDDQGLLLIATTTYDANGAVVGGRVLSYDSGQQSFATLLDLSPDAPLALTTQGSTVLVGTDSGRLLEGDSAGLSEDPSIPANLGVTRIFSDGTNLWAGVRTAQGAQLCRRTTTSSGGTPAVLGYADIKPSLMACAACHSTMSTGFPLTSGLSDDAADHAAVVAQVDLNTPDQSALLLKASNQTTHSGGAPWAPGSADYTLVLTWIQQGANFVGTPGTTPPGTTPPATTPPATPPAPGTTTSYLTHIKPLLGTCVGCHSSQSNYRLSAGLANDMADFNATVGVINKAQPDASLLLTKTSGGAAHGGGAPWPSGSTAYQTVVLWIQQGAPYAGGTAPVPPAVPAKPTYVTDVKPIISTCVGCHSREDDMRLSANLSDDTGDYRSVIGHINLGTPASSGILRRATRQSGHPVKVFDVGSLPYQILLKWIETGAPFNATSGPAPANLAGRGGDDDDDD